MAESDQDILIRILTAYEGGGMDAAKKAAADLAGTVGKNSEAGKQLNAVTELMNNNGAKAAQIFNGLAGVMRGGMDSAQSLTGALRGIGAVLGVSGPIALALSTIGLVATGLIQWRQRAEEAEAAAKKAAETQAQAAGDARKAIEDLNKVTQESVAAQVSAVSDRLTTAAAKAKELRDTLSTMENAQLELEFAGLDKQVASGTMSKEDADYSKAKRRVEVEAGQLQREKADAAARKAAAEEAISAAKKEAAGKAERAGGAEEAVVSAADAKAAAQAKVEEAEQRKKAAGVATSYGRTDTTGAYAKTISDLQQAQDELAAANTALSHAIYAQQTSLRDAAVATKALPEILARQQAELDSATASIAVIDTRLRTKAVTLDTVEAERSTSQMAAQEKVRREELEAAAAEKLAADRRRSAELDKAEADAASAEAKMPVGQRLARAKTRGTAPGQVVGDKTYYGAAAGDTRQKAQAAIEEAGQKILGGEADADIINRLVETLGRLGAVIPNMARLQVELDKLDGKIELVDSQSKNARR